MGQYEYKVIPAPRRGKRAKGAKTPAARFAHVLEDEMNVLAAERWEFVRSETLPVDEKPGLFSARVETYQTLLVFRRPLEDTLPLAQALPKDPPLADPEPALDEEDAPPRRRAPRPAARASFPHAPQGTDRGRRGPAGRACLRTK